MTASGRPMRSDTNGTVASEAATVTNSRVASAEEKGRGAMASPNVSRTALSAPVCSTGLRPSRDNSEEGSSSPTGPLAEFSRRLLREATSDVAMTGGARC